MRCVWRGKAQLGEGPVWDRRTATLYFVDLKAGVVHAWRPNGHCRTWPLGGVVSAVALTGSPDTILCVTRAGFERLDLASGALTRVAPPLPMHAGMRPNDGECDSGGNLWVGTMDDAERSFDGALYRISPGEEPVMVIEGIGVSNGLGWSPAGDVFYFTDSLRRTIYRFDCNSESSGLGERSVFATIADGAPDGLAVDDAGYVWTAIWDGGRLVRYAPDGTIDRIVALPVPRPTSLAFGGPDLATLYITSARIGLSAAALAEAPLSGGLLAFEPGVGGLPAHMTGLGS